MLIASMRRMSVQTGRFDCAGPPPILRGPHAPPSSFPSDHPAYSHIANLHVNTLQVRSHKTVSMNELHANISGGQVRSLNLASRLSDERNKEGLREQFMTFWKPEMEAWRRRWPAISAYHSVTFACSPREANKSLPSCQTRSSTFTPKTLSSCSISSHCASRATRPTLF